MKNKMIEPRGHLLVVVVVVVDVVVVVTGGGPTVVVATKNKIICVRQGKRIKAKKNHMQVALLTSCWRRSLCG